MPKDYYQTLGLSKDADEKAIKTAYRKLARKLHPDVNPGNAKAEAEFKEVGEAYAVLSDPEKRKLYDRYGHNWEAAAQGGGFDFGQGRGSVQDVDIDLGSIFGNLFGFGGQSSPFQQAQRVPPRDVERSIDVSLEEIDRGTSRTLTYQVEDTCGTCGGQGQVMMTGNRFGPCPNCRGAGVVANQRKIVVKIPAGFEDGKKLRVPGGGAKGSNGKTGDLYVLVRVAPHAVFKRKGEDTEVEVSVPFPTAALGGEVTVPTPRASGKVTVPPGTQSGQVLRLKGQGVSTLKGGRGDLLARIKVAVPKTLSERQRLLIQELRDLEEKS